MTDETNKSKANGVAPERRTYVRLWTGLGIVVAVLLPQVLQYYQQDHLIHVAGLIAIYALLALGLNVIIGYTGILNLGYAAFYGIGAYTAALLSIHLHLSFWILLPISGLAAAAAGALIGMTTLRLRGDYIAIVTLGFVEIVRLGLNNLDSITNGPKGLPGVGQTIAAPQLTLAGHVLKLDTDLGYYYFILLLALGTVFVLLRLHNSRVGRSWVSIREDESASEIMGVNTTAMKVQAFAAGTFFAGVAGCVYTHWVGFITPELFTFWESVLLVCMIVLGGMGSTAGVLLGALLIVGIPEVLRDILQQFSGVGGASAMKSFYDSLILARMLIFGVIMIAMVIFRPQGLIPPKRPRFNVRKTGADVPAGGD
ncbi:MAG: branched-chain amino acid ABC transporter permease [bacterium]